MKTFFTPLVVIAGLFSVIIITNSCAKPDHSADLPKEQQIVGKWSINRIQLKLYSGSVFIKDTIIPQYPKPENFASFDNDLGFTYRFNSTVSDVGDYKFKGSDSVISNSLPKSYRWKILMLTNTLFTVVNKGTDPAFPGYTVERYHTFVRNK
jgi:hypothetical protein